MNTKEKNIRGERKNEKPLVYSCSGCSNLAQLTNYIALDFNRKGIAEMSCIVGVGGGVKPLVKKANSGREIIVLDGCPLQCAKHCLEKENIEPALHYTLTDFGLKKKFNMDFNAEDAEPVVEKILSDLNKINEEKLLTAEAV